MRLASLFMTLGLEFQRTNWKRFLKNLTRWKALFIILPAEQDWDWPAPKGWWKPIRDRSGWRANWKRGVRSRSHYPFRGEKRGNPNFDLSWIGSFDVLRRTIPLSLFSLLRCCAKRGNPQMINYTNWKRR